MNHPGMVALLLCIVAQRSMAWWGDKVRLKDVRALTLRRGYYTTGRRSHPVPQLHCRGGSAGCKHQPSVVQCYNRGTDGVDVQWECKAQMRETQKFGWMQVTCEGYDHSRDEYVLVGSCGLQYYLERTVPGYDSSRTDVIVLILVLLICCCLCYLWYSSNQQNVPPHGVGYQPVINQPAAYPSAPPLAPNPLGNPPPYNLRFCSACQHPHTAYVTPAQIVNELPPPKCHIHVLDTHGSPNDKCSTPGDKSNPRDITSTGEPRI
ncbi:store-operated calcium entry-associated regulatory factor-like [Rhipicephalus microplus]|uniref:store-operated calcium entry-associated regulatory factor-like n=1 Tax=Rhipicephalus microplus TaxID=6941 RepID=UPI003F6B6157